MATLQVDLGRQLFPVPALETAGGGAVTHCSASHQHGHYIPSEPLFVNTNPGLFLARASKADVHTLVVFHIFICLFRLMNIMILVNQVFVIYFFLFLLLFLSEAFLTKINLNPCTMAKT